MSSPEARLLEHLVQLLRGLFALAAITGVYFWLKLPLVSAALTFVILLLSFVSSLPSLLILCAVAAGCLAYFCAPPIMGLRMDDPQDISGAAVFLLASMSVTGWSGGCMPNRVSAATARSDGRRCSKTRRPCTSCWTMQGPSCR
jgi:hypothetical protein